MIRIGILSDTHISQCTTSFAKQAATCFADVSIIFHAGDLTSTSILAPFADKKIIAVQGNMCEYSSRKVLPQKITVEIGGFSFGIIHRTGNSYDFESELVNEFPDVDCVVFGHTHQAVCKKIGNLLLVNPGSFMTTGRHGAPGTYAIIEVDKEIRCSLYEVPR